VIDIPALIQETGDNVEITERGEKRIVFLIQKAHNPIENANTAPSGKRPNRDS
jgi:tRNA 2-thiouridine synthesizing protein A